MPVVLETQTGEHLAVGIRSDKQKLTNEPGFCFCRQYDFLCLFLVILSWSRMTGESSMACPPHTCNQKWRAEEEHRNPGLKGQNNPAQGQRRAEWPKRRPEFVFRRNSQPSRGERAHGTQTLSRPFRARRDGNLPSQGDVQPRRGRGFHLPWATLFWPFRPTANG